MANDPVENPQTRAEFDAAVAEAEAMRSKISTEVFRGHHGSVCRMALAMLASELVRESPHGTGELHLIGCAIVDCCRDQGLLPEAPQSAPPPGDN